MLILNNKCRFIAYLFVLFVMMLGNPIWSAKSYMISNYKVVNFPVGKDNKLFSAIRTFEINQKKHLLVVDQATLETKIVKRENVIYLDDETLENLKDSNYKKALANFTSASDVRQNYGVTHAQNKQDASFLTIDLCPSSKTFEREFFLALTKLNDAPIAIAITGMWARMHPAEFNWLIEQRKKHKLVITWVNHSFHHYYHSTTPINGEFLSKLKDNLVSEILSVEKMLLEKGEVPSVFFRFPGLISSKDTVLELRELGLIPVATDAWLAKAQRPKPGSIILVHGNRNEHAGIKIMMEILRHKTMQLLPLYQVFNKPHLLIKKR